MKYIIMKNDNQYIKTNFEGKRTLVTNIQLADRFDHDKAKSYIINNISGKERPKCKVIEDVNSQSLESSKDNKENTVNNFNSILYNNNEITDFIFNDDNFNWLTVCEQFQSIISQLPYYKETLIEKLKLVEAERHDIDHRFEFPKKNGKEFNAVELVNLAKLKRETERKRRKIKDELFLAGIFETSSLEDFRNNRVAGKVKGLQNRKYAPRVLNELFE